MAEQSNELTGQEIEKTVEDNKVPEATKGRRQFARNLATALGLTAVVATSSVTAAPGNGGGDKVKSRILQQIQSDLEIEPIATDCYDRGPVGDHYSKGDCKATTELLAKP